MAKLNRESKLRDKRAEKHARKAARKLTAANDAAQAASQLEQLRDGLVGHDPGVRDGAERAPDTAASREDGQ